MTSKKDSRNRGFEEKAHLNTDQETFEKNHEDIFGAKKKFCEVCGNRIAYCECIQPLDEKIKDNK
jgi:hypothetical protein